jgi:ubiquinone/menaquinone biosynthesis C-methylase UbiE
MFKQRVIEPELLDHVPPEEARPNLADLVRINRMLGGHHVLRRTLRSISSNQGAPTFLDVGAASGDSAGIIRERFPESIVTSLDYNPTNIEKAPHPKLLGNAFELPFERESFDYVLCSLFLHHFQNSEVIELLRCFYSMARKGVIVCDLERHILPYLFLPATKFLFGWNRITVHDGLKSVRAAFRADELTRLAKAAGMTNVQTQVHRPAFRLSLIGFKEGAGGHSEEIPTGARTTPKGPPLACR